MAGAGAAATYMQLHDIDYTRDFNCADLNISGRKINLVKHKMIEAATARAEANGLIIDNDISDDNGVKVTCTSTDFDKYLEVEVRITAQTETSFLHIITGQPLTNTVTAVTRVRPTRPAAGGFAIASVDLVDCGQNSGGVWFDGNVTTVLEGGGVYSGTCITDNGSAGSVQVKYSEGGIARTKVTKVNFTDENGDPNNPKVDSTFKLDIQIPAPDCSGLTTYSSPDYSKPLEPGIYSNGITKTAMLKPGLYCIDADVTSGNVSGDGVTLYFRNGASIKLTGKETLSITAPSTEHPAAAPAVKGLLMYFDSGSFEMTGKGTANLEGTIYAPLGDVKLGGNSDLAGSYVTEIIADHVKIHGNPGDGIQYDATKIYVQPPSLDFLR